MAGILTHLVCSLLYTLLAVYFWRTRWHVGAAAVAVTPKAWEHHAVLAPFALHTLLIYHSAFGSHGLYLGLGNAVSLIIWLAVAIYWLGGLIYRLEGLQALVLPLAAVAALLPLAFPSQHPLPNTEMFAFKAHLLIAMLAYGLFTIASLHVLLMALMERRLHGGTLPPVLSTLPPLLTMETLLFQMIGAGFVLLTLTLASGILFSEELFGKPLTFNHKTVFAILSWLVFGALLTGRIAYGWRGRTAMRWTLAGFLMLVLAYIGSKFVLEVILHR
ncbi:MAG TPA: cytochrome c biogenesis protein CcsA [Burkholderiales bacterium]|nr:cytochrome c biogenesis protein CcsA [Burkholderiales bacterium]